MDNQKSKSTFSATLLALILGVICPFDWFARLLLLRRSM